MELETIEVADAYAGPPNMGHGGYVAGLFDGRWPGACQVRSTSMPMAM